MSLSFVHLSDIHFGQEKGGQTKINDDAKEQLIRDVSEFVTTLQNGRAAGIIVTGDIAYSGLDEEYKAAGVWLDRVAHAAGCEITDIQVVPGNHDIDRSQITALTQTMLHEISRDGDPALDKYLRSAPDRELLFKRFTAYQPFAEGYRCPLDTTAALAEERLAELAPGRSIRFVRINSALICSTRDEEGRLFLGAGQRVITERPGEELVVLSHHPMHWFQDSDDALRYLRNRGRVYISGHEHNPSVRIEEVEPGKDLMMLAAGATVPPHADADYTYCYNVIEFDWDATRDALAVTVHARCWRDSRKKFIADEERLGGASVRHLLGSPNFRGASLSGTPFPQEVTAASEILQISSTDADGGGSSDSGPADNYALLVLRFFRDLSPSQRLSTLVSLQALPNGWNGVLNEAFERKVLDSLVKAGRSNEVWREIERIQSIKQGL